MTSPTILTILLLVLGYCIWNSFFWVTGGKNTFSRFIGFIGSILTAFLIVVIWLLK